MFNSILPIVFINWTLLHHTCSIMPVYVLCFNYIVNGIYNTVEDWYNHQISNLLQKKTTKTKQRRNVGNNK